MNPFRGPTPAGSTLPASTSSKERTTERKPRRGAFNELFPAMAGAIEWSDRHGTLVDANRRMMWTSIAGWSVAAIACIGWLRSADEPKAVPYIIQVDKTGYAVAIQPAEKSSPTDERVRLSAVSRWVRAMRTVIGNEDAQRALVDDVYAMLSADSNATKKTNEWYRTHNPMLSVGTRHVEVELRRVYAMRTPSTFTVEWEERTRTSNGQEDIKQFSAFLSVETSPTQKLADVIGNPLGIYISDYTVTEL